MVTEIPGSLSLVRRHLPSLLTLVDPGLYFLHNHIWSDVSSENDFSALLWVGRLMLEIATQDPSVLQKFSHFASEVRIDSRRSCFITEFTFHLEEICA
jgi:hypothetical protein